MPNKFVFADEAGNFDFSRRNGASKYFVLTTMTVDDCAIGEALLRLRRSLVWDGHDVRDGFHATEDTQAVRDAVFGELMVHPFRIDATILEKSKAQTHLADDTAFYKMAWFLHFKHVAPLIVSRGDQLQVVSASLGTAKKKKFFRAAIEDVARQVLPNGITARVASWSAESDPCLQAADYCCWAVQRKWERNDARSHVIVQSRIASEFDVWRLGTVHHY